ncbi:ABC transporter ATP-binding protein [Amorphus orientalis]|uniref:Branched-chain amino acid transport system ATP-binding protein n=1 Tax=Amorphus orientalis TaxID=649198 RepID=A0AAE3VPP0_9HYPH|nr:ABC transporter ATP-binding protein [Amorphus orientalis]MDQ0316009.1 branched-chain amino acid transport system ATP-binding protein [Amorphus orientalis]
MSLLAVKNLSRRFGGVTAVDDVSFTVGAGEAVALIGPNGAGKSTCFNLIDGQLAADTGEIVFDGQTISGLKPRQLFRLGIARTFQIATVFPTMTVAENVQLALLSHRREIFRFAGAVAKRHRSEAVALLARVGLADSADRAARMLAYGDVKRLELAIALANRPRLLLMDEPAAGMAPQERAGLVELVRGVVADGQVSVLFTEHSMDVVFSFADRVLVLADGRLIASGTPDEVRADRTVQERYLGTGPEARA